MNGLPSGASDFTSDLSRYWRKMMRKESGTTLSVFPPRDIAILYIFPSWILIPLRELHLFLSDSIGVMKKKFVLSKPVGYPPSGESSGYRKKLNGPNHSGLWFFSTFGVVTTIRTMAGKSGGKLVSWDVRANDRERWQEFAGLPRSSHSRRSEHQSQRG